MAPRPGFHPNVRHHLFCSIGCLVDARSLLPGERGHALRRSRGCAMTMASLPLDAPSADMVAVGSPQGVGHHLFSRFRIGTRLATIDQLWSTYAATAKGPLESALADHFAQRREQYLRDAVMPTLAALRNLDYQDTQRLATKGRLLYERASPEVQALIDLQFDRAHAEYASGVQRYEQTRSLAVGALVLSMVVLGFLGVMLIRSIVRPLRQVSQVFHHIADGRLDTPIVVQGQDEICEVLADLQAMQQRLAANEEAIYRLAYYDPLTDLPNRRLLRERIQTALTASREDDQHRAVLLLDLDHFKAINDTLGHEVGDQYLVEMAHRLRQTLQAPHAVARIGGDEFVVLTDALSTDETA